MLKSSNQRIKNYFDQKSKIEVSKFGCSKHFQIVLYNFSKNLNNAVSQMLKVFCLLVRYWDFISAIKTLGAKQTTILWLVKTQNIDKKKKKGEKTIQLSKKKKFPN